MLADIGLSKKLMKLAQEIENEIIDVSGVGGISDKSSARVKLTYEEVRLLADAAQRLVAK